MKSTSSSSTRRPSSASSATRTSRSTKPSSTTSSRDTTAASTLSENNSKVASHSRKAAEHHHHHSVADVHQRLSTFVKKRNQDLDEEINALRTKITSTERGKILLTTQPLTSRGKGKGEGSDANVLSSSSTVSTSSRQKEKAPKENTSIENDSIEHLTEFESLRVDGLGYHPVESPPKPSLENSKIKPKLVDKRSDQGMPYEADRLVTFLAKLKLKCEDAGLTGHELRQLLLADDLYIPGETWVSIEELTEVFQTDLLFPLTKPDQRLILEEYGNKHGLVDVQNLLVDAGLWDEEDDDQSPSRELPARMSYQTSSVLVSPSPSPSSSPSPRERESLEGRSRSSASSRQVLTDVRSDLLRAGESPPTSSELKPKPALSPVAEDEIESQKSLAQSTDRPSSSWAEDSNSIPDSDKRTTSGRPPRPSDSFSSRNFETQKLRELAEENQRLKEEMRNFDGEFFEQLEDLKYRYSKLQEVLGEDPLLRASAKEQWNIKDGSKSGQNLPLDKLAWSVRRSMTAIDRARYDSPLVTGPRAAHAYTYAPGQKSSFPEPSPRHLGGSLSVSQSENQAFLLDTMGRGPDRDPPKSLDRARAGGVHGIGAGTYSFSAGDASDPKGDSMANLCERRLAFELASHPKPDDAILTLINQVMDIGDQNRLANSKKGESVLTDKFITVPQLQNCIAFVKLQMSDQEVAVLATGFASDGKGGINCEEFCQMVQAIAYNLRGSYSRTYQDGTNRGRQQGKSGTVTNFRRRKEADEEDEESQDKTSSKQFQAVLRELCDAIVTFDKRSVLGASGNLHQTLLKPFIEVDIKGKGWMAFYEFKQTLRELGAMLSGEEYSILASPFLLMEEKAEAAYPSSNLNHIQSFRDAKLTGSLSGYNKSAGRGRFGDFLSSHGLEGVLGEGAVDDNGERVLSEDSMIDYVSFVDTLSRVLAKLLDEKGGLPIVPKLPWIMKEFEFIDVLLSQLESMKASTRRKTLITLQYAFENADNREMGELDGFAILTALINCGFRLQRYERVQLLRAAEEYGGLLDYARLVLVLLQTVVDWTQSEREIVFKILRAMGVTVEQRRNWLARLKKELLERSTQQKVKLKAKEQSSTITNLKESYQQSMERSGGRASATGDVSYEIPPAVFLYVLRELHVDLSPEEEAILLDCLDTERIAKLQAKRLTDHLVSTSSKKRTLWNSQSNNPSYNQTSEFALPSVDYQSFVSFCARHCGSWIDSNPKLYESIYTTIQSMHYPLMALQEFVLLCKSFDELNSGYISQRAFLICCNRSTLFAQLAEEKINELAMTLCIEGAGEIEYRIFCLQLRGMCASVQQDNGQHSTIHSSGLTIVQQIIRNASDQNNLQVSQSLLPLRKWLILHTDTQSLILTLKEFNALLREFSVIYRPEDLDLLFMEIGQDLDQHALLDLNRSKGKKPAAGSVSRFASDLDDAILPLDNQINRVRVVSTKKLLQLLNRQRSAWTSRHPVLARQLMKALQTLPVEASTDQEKEKSKQYNQTRSSQATSQIALALIKVVSRLEAFSISLAHLEDDDSEDEGFQSSKKSSGGQRKVALSNMNNLDSNTMSLLAKHPLDATGQRQEKLLEIDIFDYLLRSMGIHVQKDDLLFLADASDPQPEAHFINIYLLFDLLRMQEGLSTSDRYDEENDESEQTSYLSEASLYALNHLKELIWKVWSQTVSLRPSTRGYENKTANTSNSRKNSSGGSTSLDLSTRTAMEWINDVKCVFQGFDIYQNGLISLQDFILALNCLNVKMSLDLIRDIAPFVGPAPSGPVQYKKILSYVLANSSSSSSTKPVSSGLEGEGDEAAQEAETTKRAKVKTSSNIKKEKNPVNAATRRLLHAVRRNVCLKNFILNKQHLEEAWMDMLRVFHTFDPNESNLVSARDFCLAVAVLMGSKAKAEDENVAQKQVKQLIGSEELILSKSEWEDIIEFFTVKHSAQRGARQPTNSRGELLLLDYMLFCELVLDPKEVNTRLRELQNHPDVRQLRAEYAKENVLSQRPTTSSSPSLQVNGRSASASRGREDPVKTQSVTLNKKFYGFDDDRSVSSASNRPSSASRISRSPAVQSSSVQKDEIASRFSKAQGKHKHSMAFGRSYNDTTRSSSSALSDDSPPSAAMRVNATQGQSSRDAAANRRNMLLQTTGGRDLKPLASYAQSQTGYGDSSLKARVRFNATVS